MSLAKILPLLLAAAPLALVQPALAQVAGGPGPGITTQLPRGAVPSHYAIVVTPDAANLKFSGEAVIDLTVAQAMPALVLNAADLTVSAVTLTPARGKPIKGTARLDAAAQTVSFDFGKPIQPGSYRLAVSYAGVINTQANGLFALDYTDEGSGQARRGIRGAGGSR